MYNRYIISQYPIKTEKLETLDSLQSIAAFQQILAHKKSKILL